MVSSDKRLRVISDIQIGFHARGRVPLSEVLSELRAEETRLRGAGLLEVPSVLAARGPPVSSAPLRSPVPSILSTPPVQGQSQPQQLRGQN
jgi:hypothetical protein